MFYVFLVLHGLFIGVDFGIFLRSWRSYKTGIENDKGYVAPGPFWGGAALRSVRRFTKSQNLYREGKLSTFSSLMLFIKGESYIRRLARCFALLNPRAYTGGKARNFVRSPPNILPNVTSSGDGGLEFHGFTYPLRFVGRTGLMKHVRIHF